MSLENKWSTKLTGSILFEGRDTATMPDNGDNIPANEAILIVYTRNEKLYRLLKQWAYKTNCTLLYNPDNYILEAEQNFFAIVIDSDLITTCSIPKKITERLIPSELPHNLIEKILHGLKPVASGKTDT